MEFYYISLELFRFLLHIGCQSSIFWHPISCFFLYLSEIPFDLLMASNSIAITFFFVPVDNYKVSAPYNVMRQKETQYRTNEWICFTFIYMSSSQHKIFSLLFLIVNVMQPEIHIYIKFKRLCFLFTFTLFISYI